MVYIDPQIPSQPQLTPYFISMNLPPNRITLNQMTSPHTPPRRLSVHKRPPSLSDLSTRSPSPESLFIGLFRPAGLEEEPGNSTSRSEHEETRQGLRTSDRALSCEELLKPSKLDYELYAVQKSYHQQLNRFYRKLNSPSRFLASPK